MRISTGMIYDSGLASIQNRTSSLLRTQQQVASGRRLLNPSDDPVAAARALEVTQAQAVNLGQATTRDNAKGNLGLADTQLQSATDLMARVRELAVQGGSAALSAADRRSIATELRARFDELIGLANGRDGTGLFLFGGYQTGNKPFSGSVENGVVYGGDDGVRALGVSTSRSLAISNSGNDVFMNIKNGNGVFATGMQNEKSANANSVVYESALTALSNPPANVGSFELRFWVDSAGVVGPAGATYYDLVNSYNNSLFTGTTSTTGLGGTYTNAYVPGTALDLSNVGPPTFDYDATIYFTGAPQTGDTFSVDRSATALTLAPAAVAQGAQAVIDKGSVTDPLKWNTPANGGDFELRFWVDTQGTVATSGQAVGSVSLPPAVTVVAGDEQFNLSINGGAAQLVTLTAGAYATPSAFAAHVQTRVNAALGAAPPAAGSASVTLDSDNRLVITSTTAGAASAVTLTEGNGALAAFFGTPVASAGAAAQAGQTFYDWVDPATGNSLFTGTASTAGGAGNTYNHRYTSGSQISLANAGGPGQLAFDFGAQVQVTGTPANGDAFVIAASDSPIGNSFFTTEPRRATQYNTGSGIIGAGEVLDEQKWNTPANSRNLEIRFWQDPDDPNTTYYDLVDAETEFSLFSNSTSTAGGPGNTFLREFKAGDSISFGNLDAAYGTGGNPGDFGISVTIDGTPASGDAFSIRPSETESVFVTLTRLIEGLEEGAPFGTAGNTHLATEVGLILKQVSNIEDNFLRVRASIGSRLAEIDSLDVVGENLNLQYEETLSSLQDLDYAEAITKLTREQVELQAAQQSFTRIAQLSLFDYL